MKKKEQKIQNKNGEGDFPRGNEQQDKQDAAMLETRTPEIASRAQRQENYNMQKPDGEAMPKYAHHEPDTLGGIIEKMMDEEDTNDEIQSQTRGKQTAQDKACASTKKPNPTPKTKTTRAKIRMKGIIKKDTAAQEKHAQEDYKNHQPDSLGREIEAMMTPTVTTDSQPREEQAACRRRSTITPTEASQHTVKRQCAGKRDT